MAQISHQIVRKSGIAFSSNQYPRSETEGKLRNSPIVVLERLNIPLNSTVLVKDNSVIYSVDLPSRNSQKDDVIVISGSESSEDEEFQKPCTSDNSPLIFKRIESFHSFEPVSRKQQSSDTFCSVTSKIYSPIHNVKPGQASHKKLIAQKNVLKRKSIQTSNTTRRTGNYDTHKNQILIQNNAKNYLDFESAEKMLEHKIESAGFINMITTIKKNAVSDKISLTVNNNNDKNAFSFSPGKKTLSNKTNNKKPLNAEQLDTSSAVQNTSADIQERLITSSILGDNILPNETIVANSNKHTPSRDQNVPPSSKPDPQQTPSRTSERIKNKKVKFSALKLLAGADFLAMRRELNSRTRSRPKKTSLKANSSDTVDIHAINSPLRNVLRSEDTDNLLCITESRLNGNNDILMMSSTEVKEDNMLLKRLSDKIKIQLKGAPEKKIVNISVTPAKEFLKIKDSQKEELKQKLDLELGPDIIIRRVRSEKKQISEESSDTIENSKNRAASKNRVNTEETLLNDNPLMLNNLKIKNPIYSEKSATPGSQPVSEIEIPPQIRKLLLKASKNQKSIPKTRKRQFPPNKSTQYIWY